MADHARPPRVRVRIPGDRAICLVAAAAAFVVCAGVVIVTPKDHHDAPRRPVAAAVVPVADHPPVRPIAPQRAVQPRTAASLWVTVRPGDCLWTIARAHHVSWWRLYELNRGRVGSDPDLIHAGLRLRLPVRSLR